MRLKFPLKVPGISLRLTQCLQKHPVLVSWLFALCQDRNVINCHMIHRPKQPSYLGEIKRTHLLRPSKLDVQIAAGGFCLQLTNSLLGNSTTLGGVCWVFLNVPYQSGLRHVLHCEWMPRKHSQALEVSW